MVKLQRFIQKNNLRLVDFFNDFDTDGSMSVTYDEFEIGLKVCDGKFEIGLKLQRFVQKNNLRLVDFFNDFDTDGSMRVTYDEFEIGLKVCELV